MHSPGRAFCLARNYNGFRKWVSKIGGQRCNYDVLTGTLKMNTSCFFLKAQVFLDRIYKIHGLPCKIVSDGDPVFTLLVCF